MKNKYIKRLYKTLLSSCNPESKQFYGSLMLNNGGKLILKVSKNIDTPVEPNNDFQKIVD